MMKIILYIAALLAVQLTVSLSSPVACSGNDHRSERALKTGLRILNQIMCPSERSQRKLAHLVREACEVIITETLNDTTTNQTMSCDLLYFITTTTDEPINYPKCSERNITDCNCEQEGDFIQLWCSQALICSHLTGDGRVDDVLCEGDEDVPGWYNHNAGEILCNHKEVCPRAYGLYSLPEDYCSP